MNSTERDGDGGRGVKAGEEIDQKTESGQNVKEIKDQNGKEEISVKVQDELDGLGEQVKGDQVEEEEDKVEKVKEEVDKVEVKEEDGVETFSRLSDRGKPWISTIYNTGSLLSSSSGICKVYRESAGQPIVRFCFFHSLADCRVCSLCQRTLFLVVWRLWRTTSQQKKPRTSTLIA